MKIYTEVQSQDKPLEVDIRPEVVYVASDVEEIEDGYQYTMTEYTKDEYITLLSSTQEQQNEDIDSCMVALTEIYEMMEG